MSGKEFDKSAYVLYHTAQTGYPCLSFDIICDDDGSGEERITRDKQSLYLVAGTQAPRAQLNAIHLLFFDKLTKFKRKQKNEEEDDDDDEEDSDSSDSDSDDDENPANQPTLRSVDIPHPWGEINRIRYTSIGTTGLAASWCGSGKSEESSPQLFITSYVQCLTITIDRKSPYMELDKEPTGV